MGGGKGGKTPKAPDPVKTAEAQTQTNKETAYWNAVLNNVNQITPYGTLKYTQTGGGKQYNMDAYNNALNAWNTATANGANTGANSTPLYKDAQGNLTPNSWSYGPNSIRVNNTLYSGTVGGATGSGAMPKLEDFYTGVEAPPQFTSTIELSPEQQKILDSQNRRDIALGQLGEDQIGRIRDSVSNPYSYANLQNNFSSDDIATQQANAEAAILSRLNPQFAKDEEALRTRLINQGIGQGSQAYKAEMDAFNQKVNDARTQAILSGQQYGSTAQNQALQRRNQEINEYNAQRNAPLNEYIGLTSGVQVQNPSFGSQSYGGAQPVDYAGLVNQGYQNAIGQYNANQASANNQSQAMSQLFGLGGSAIGGPIGGFIGSGIGSLFSDIRLKENIEEVGEENGYKIYEFNYINSPNRYRGVMAQDVESINPDAVVMDISGYKRVNYSMLGLEMTEVANG